jgi:hypothetical protein
MKDQPVRTPFDYRRILFTDAQPRQQQPVGLLQRALAGNGPIGEPLPVPLPAPARRGPVVFPQAPVGGAGQAGQLGGDAGVGAHVSSWKA